VLAFVKSRLRSLRACQEKQMRLMGRAIGGRVTLAFSVDDEGRTSKVSVDGSKLGSAEIVACLTSVVRFWRVNPAPDTTVDVELPLVFSAAE